MLETSTRLSSGMIKSRTEASRMVRAPAGASPQFRVGRGVLSARTTRRAPLSPRCTALTAASCGNHGAAPNFGTRVPGNLGGGILKKFA